MRWTRLFASLGTTNRLMTLSNSMSSATLIDKLVPEDDCIIFSAITAKDIQQTFADLKGASVPGPAAKRKLHNTCEQPPHFPRLFSEIVTTNIPKGSGKARPQHLRPITVLPMLCRFYAKLPRLDFVADIKLTIDHHVAEKAS